MTVWRSSLTGWPGGIQVRYRRRRDMKAESRSQSRPQQRKPGDPTSRRPRVLLAEDDRYMRSLLTYEFERAGYRVTTCVDGWSLLSHLGSFLLASSNHEDIDIVVSDIRMPGVDGMEVLRGAEDCPMFPPMILITAFGDIRTHVEARRFGAVAIFDKPFDVDALIAKVRSVVPPPRSGGSKAVSDDGPPETGSGGADGTKDDPRN
jgi:DNA-binding response OmpR family regulator